MWPSLPSPKSSVIMKKQQAPVLSGMDAWSVFLSFLKTIFPSCRTDDTTFNMAEVRREEQIRHKCQYQGLESKGHWGPRAGLHLSPKKTQFWAFRRKPKHPNSLLRGEKTWLGGTEYFWMVAKNLALQWNTMQQGMAIYSQWTKSGPMPAIVNKVLLEPSHTHSLTYCL